MRDRRGCRAVVVGGLAIVLVCLVYGGLAGAVLYRGEIPLYAPRVTGVEPLPGSPMLPTTSITLRFDQPMDRESVGAAFSVEPGTPGSLEWGDGNERVTFVPSGTGFATGNEYTIRLDEQAQAATLGRSLTRGVEWRFTMAPMLEGTEPAPGVEGLGAYPALRAEFNYPIECGTTFRAFSITPDAVGILGCRDQTFVFSPTVSLAPDTVYEASLAHAFVKDDPAPRPGAAWTFRTAPGLVVEDVRPGRAGFLVDLHEPARVVFNRPMVADSIVGRFRVVSEMGEVVPGQVAWQEGGRVLVFEPSAPWLPGIGYRISLDAGVYDDLGFELAEAVTSDFGTLRMLGLPLPVPGSQDVALDSEVRVPFTRPMDRASVEAGLVMTPAIDGTYAWDEDTLVLTPQGGLAGETAYEFSLQPDVRDASGAPLGRAERWSFSTEPLLRDAVVPAGEPLLALGRPLTLTFALPMDRASVAAALAVTPDTPGELAWGSEGRTVTFRPEPGWQAGAAYRVRLSGAARAAGGGQTLGEGRSWAFDTAAAEVWFGDGRPMQVIDATGDRAFQFAYQGPEIIGFQVYALTTTQFIEAYKAGDDYTGTLTATLAWREAAIPAAFAVPGADWQPAAAHLPADLDPGLYLLSTVPASEEQGALWVSLTEHAILLKETVADRGAGLQREVLAWDVAFDSTPVASATLTLYDRQGVPLAAGVTGVDGILSLDVAAAPGPWLALSEAGGDPAVVGLGDMLGEAGIGMDVTGRTPITYTPPAIYLETDRPAYHPGDTIYYRAILRSGAPTATVQLHAPVGQVTGTEVLTASAFGTVEGSVTLPDDALVGTWDVAVATDEASVHRGVYVVTGLALAAEPAADAGRGAALDLELGRALYTVGEAITVTAHARDDGGDPAAGATVAAQIVGWDEQVVADAVADTDRTGAASFVFQLPMQGAYEVRVAATDEEGLDARAGGAVTVYDPVGEAPLYAGTWGEALDVTVARDEYAAGDEATMLVYSEEGGPALWTVEGDGVPAAQVITLSAGSNVLTLPVGADLAPEVEVWVYRPRGGDEGAPEAGFVGAMDRFQISRADRRLAVAIECDDEVYAPEAEATCRIEVTDADGQPVLAETSVSVTGGGGGSLVGEGPFEALYGGRPNYVRTYDSSMLGRVLPSAPPQAVDDLDEAPANLTGTLQVETAYWAPDLVTGAGGTVSVTLALPDEAAAWQVVARAVTTDTRVGQAVAQLVTTETIRVEPLGLPPFLVAGDAVTLTTAIRNSTAQPVSVTVAVAAEGLVLAAEAARLPPFHVAARGVATATWPAEVTAAGGDAAWITFRATATRRGTRLVGRDDAEVVLPVQPQVVPQAEVFAGELRAEAPEAAITFTLPAELAGGTSRLEVRLAPSLPAALADAYGSLAGPDAGVSGTVEAATSRVLAGATLTEVVPGDRRAADVAQGLQQLYAAQDADGRWRAWRDGAPGADTPGGDGADAYQTGYAILALAAARDAGLVVDEGVLADGEAALARLLPEAAPEVQAWGAYALLSAGAPLSPTLSPGDGRDLGPAPQAALALALDAMGEVEEAASLIDLLYTSALTEAGRVHWQAGGTAWAGQAMRSPVAETALVLHALAQLDPASDLLAGGARWLMAQRRGQGWATPHETALALVALSDYLAVAAPEAGEAAYRLSLNGELWDEGALSAGTLHTAVVTYTEAVSPALLLPGENVLRVALDGDEVVPAGPLYYAVIWAAYLPADGVEPASDAAGSGMARGHRLPWGHRLPQGNRLIDGIGPAATFSARHAVARWGPVVCQREVCWAFLPSVQIGPCNRRCGGVCGHRPRGYEI